MGTLALLVAVGMLGPVLAAGTRLAVPVIVGEIVAGVLVGPQLLGWLDPQKPVVVLLHDAGFALLMFEVGLTLPLREPALREGLRRASAAVGISVVLAAGLGFAIAGATGLHEPGAIAVVVATSSAALAMPVLSDVGPLTGARATAAAWILIADVLTVLALPLVAHDGSILKVLGASLALSVVAAAVVGVLHLVDRRSWWERFRGESKEKRWGVDLRVALALAFGLTWLAGTLGTSPLVAGFAAGVVVSASGRTPHRLVQQIVGVGEGFLIPIFFVVLGASVDVGSLSHRSDFALALLILAGTCAVHVVAAVATRQPFGVGLLATAQMGVPAALVTLGLDQGWLTAGQGAAFMAAAVGSIATTSVGARLVRGSGAAPVATAPGAEPLTR